jgi:hypothetical protein
MDVCVPYSTHTVKEKNENLRVHNQLRVLRQKLARREKVFQEIQRPVFSLLDRAPLSECCTFISYDNVEQLAREKHLGYLSDAVLDEFSEEAE